MPPPVPRAAYSCRYLQIPNGKLGGLGGRRLPPTPTPRSHLCQVMQGGQHNWQILRGSGGAEVTLQPRALDYTPRLILAGYLPDGDFELLLG